jgi:hypothetical protein
MSLDTFIATLGGFDPRKQNHSFLKEQIERRGRETTDKFNNER